MLKVLFGLLLCASTLAWNRENFFRRDYTFYKDVDGWLKFHVTPTTWSAARLKCHREGTVLASALSYELSVAMMSAMNGTTEIWMGTHATFPSRDFYSDEGELQRFYIADWEDTEEKEQCMTMDNDTSPSYHPNCTDLLPYICFKKWIYA